MASVDHFNRAEWERNLRVGSFVDVKYGSSDEQEEEKDSGATGSRTGAKADFRVGLVIAIQPYSALSPSAVAVAYVDGVNLEAKSMSSDLFPVGSHTHISAPAHYTTWARNLQVGDQTMHKVSCTGSLPDEWKVCTVSKVIPEQYLELDGLLEVINADISFFRPLFTQSPPSLARPVLASYGHSLKRSDRLDCRDTVGKWVDSFVIGETSDHLQVHFILWAVKWDEWIERDSDRLQPFHSKVSDYSGNPSIPEKWRSLRLGQELAVLRVRFPPRAASNPDASQSRPVKCIIPAATPLILTSYDQIEFVDPPANLACLICTSDVVFDPPNLECGCIFCRSCIEKCNPRTCANCRNEFNLPLLQNGFVKRQIYQSKVKCIRSSSGCEWVGELGTQDRNLKEHHLKCAYRSFNCSACKKLLLVKDAERHATEECDLRSVLCEHCGDEIQSRHLAQHQLVGDPYFTESTPREPCMSIQFCPNKCTNEDGSLFRVRIDQVMKHVTECPQRRATCKFCSQQILGISIDLHEKEQCSRRIVSCGYCLNRLEAGELVAHRAGDFGGASCAGLRLCENRCINPNGSPFQVRVNLAAAHLLTCPLRRTVCSMCSESILAVKIERHKLNECTHRLNNEHSI